MDESKFYQKFPKLDISKGAIIGCLKTYMSDLDISDFQNIIPSIINDAWAECFKKNVKPGTVVMAMRAGFGGTPGKLLHFHKFVERGDLGDSSDSAWGDDYFVFEEIYGEYEPEDQLPRTVKKQYLSSPARLWEEIKIFEE